MIPIGKNNYLVDIPDREHEAILRLFELPFIYQPFFTALGFNSPLAWYLLEIREHHFTDLLASEVDILGGPLVFTDFGEINWSQSTKYLIAVEVKCAYRHEDSIKSQKSSPQKMNKIQSKIEELLKAGFDKAVLLDIIANPPASGSDIRAWFNTLDMANTSLKMFHILQDRLSNDLPAGHWVWSWGSVIGGEETDRGAGAPVELRRADQNPFLKGDLKVQTRRREVERKLYEILSKFSMPLSFGYSVILIDCRYCGKIHSVKDSCQ